MFRKVNIKDNSNIDKFILMKNTREEFCEIPKEFIDSIEYKFQDYDIMKLTIPNKITHNGITVDNIIYDKFLGKRQQILFGKERYIIDECEINSESNGKKVKSITAYSFEKTLEVTYDTGSISRQLYKGNDELYIADGILDEFLLDNPSWSIGVVTEKARKEFGRCSEEFTVSILDSLLIEKVERGMTLWEKDFTEINPIDDKNVVTLQIHYSNIKSYDTLNDNKFLKEEKETHNSFGNLHTGISKIKATYDGNDTYRYAVKYEITFTDGLTKEFWEEFTNLDGLKCEFDAINLYYTNGNEVDIENIKMRNFDEGSYQWIDFLRKNVSEAYDVVFIFDNYNRILNCYALEEVGENNGLILSYENFVKSINQNLQYSDICNKLYVKSDNANISEENPTGNDYILDYTYYINNGLMSEELLIAWNRYTKLLEGDTQTDILEKRLELNGYNKYKIKLESEKTTLEENIRGLEVIRSAYIKSESESDIKRLSEEINQKQDKLTSILRDITECKDNIAELDDWISEKVKSIQVETARDDKGEIFTKDLLTELKDITNVMELTDEHSLTNYRLYQNSVEILKERNKLNIQFETTLVGLIQNLPRDNAWNEWIVLGDFVNLEEENLMETGEGRIRIVGFTYIPKEHKVSNISFSNRDKNLDELSKLSTIGEKINRSNTYTNNYKDIWKNSTSVNDYINKMLTDGLEMKAQGIKSRAETIKIDMSESGIFLIDATNENNQLYLSSSMMAITNDRWLNAKCAIDENGIIAKQLVGEIILGHKLYITSENGEFYIGDMDDLNKGFGLSIKDANDVQRVFLGTELENGVRKARLRLYGKDGKGLVLSEDGIVSEFQYPDRSAVDLNSPMYSYFRIGSNVNILKECILMIKLRPFRVYSKGMEGGGAYVQGVSTLSGGGTTSSSGGGYSNTMTSSNQNYATFQSEFTTNPQVEYSGNEHVHPISKFQFDHNHSVSISIGAHSHNCPNHSHTTNLNIPNHTHAEKYGCYDLGGTENIPSNVILKVNGKVVRSNINSDTEVDITSYLTIGRVNEIILESSTRGQIYINLYSKSFVTW